MTLTAISSQIIFLSENIFCAVDIFLWSYLWDSSAGPVLCPAGFLFLDGVWLDLAWLPAVGCSGLASRYVMWSDTTLPDRSVSLWHLPDALLAFEAINHSSHPPSFFLSSFLSFSPSLPSFSLSLLSYSLLSLSLLSTSLLPFFSPSLFLSFSLLSLSLFISFSLSLFISFSASLFLSSLSLLPPVFPLLLSFSLLSLSLLSSLSSSFSPSLFLSSLFLFFSFYFALLSFPLSLLPSFSLYFFVIAERNVGRKAKSLNC